MAVERHFAELGHTYRHGRLYRKFEHHFSRPMLKLALRSAGLYSRGVANAVSPIVRRVRLRFGNLPSALDGFQLLHLSDLHIDGTEGLTQALLPILSELQPDVCVMTGDYRFEDRGSCAAVYPLMRRVVRSIQARFGIFGILGNHDSSEIAYELEDMGVQMLINEAVQISSGVSPFWMIGVDDPFDYRCHNLKQAMQGVPKAAFRVLLAHAPEIYEEAAAEGVDLYLTGHTHAGQIRVPFWGAVKQNANCPSSYSYGPWQHAGMQGYTSAGIGCSSLPVRYNCPPEIVLIELVSEPEIVPAA